MTRQEVMRQWSLGFAYGVALAGERQNNEHWERGFEAGYSMRHEKNRMLDEYMIKTGREPQIIIRATNQETTDD